MIATRLYLLDVIRWMYRRTLGWLMINVCKWEYGGKLTLTPCFRCSSQRQNVKGVNESERGLHTTRCTSRQKPEAHYWWASCLGVEVEKVSGMLRPTVVKSLTQIPAQPRVTHITPTQIHKYKYRHIKIHKYQLNLTHIKSMPNHRKCHRLSICQFLLVNNIETSSLPNQ